MALFDKIIYHWHFSKINIIKTILFNLKTLPFKTAIKFPIFLYGKIDIYFLQGKIEFQNCTVKKGMVKLGWNKEFLGTKNGGLILLNQKSKIIFKGNAEISGNFLIRVGENAILTIGNNFFLGSSSKIVCIHKISIGDGTLIAFESQIIDSDFHYIYDIEKELIQSREREIVIGDFNWIGNRTTILKGTKTDIHTIVACCSILRKDYIQTESKNVILAGNPATVAAKNKRRIVSLDLENKLIHFYKNSNNRLTDELKNEIKKSLEDN
ncbi:MAG: acyltransferase [Arachidicoccus sp.]|nr:acyltransferase [Arachidicoccus sp.]